MANGCKNRAFRIFLNYRNVKTTKILALSSLLVGMALASCNEKSDSTEIENPVSLAVTEFKLKYNPDNKGVDSVYFSINLNERVIYNADSLRKGTKIDKLVPTISYSTDIDEATIEMTGGTTREGTVDYKKNPTDSIDFTGDVRLTLRRADNSITYRIKVNVHKENPDTLVWGTSASTTLPSRLASPVAQKTVTLNDQAVTLIEESDGTYTIASATDLAVPNWRKAAVTFPFTPNVSTFTGSAEALWILSDTGALYKSTDMQNWTATGETWTTMIGSYLETVVGIKENGGKEVYAQYPLTSLNVKEIDTAFPRQGGSNFVVLQNKWTSSPVGFFCGGIDSSGRFVSATWAFDGTEWVALSEGGIPAVEGASVIPYYYYRRSASGSAMNEYSVWLLVGGLTADGTLNRTVYITYDNGVNWMKGSEQTQLPAEIPAMAYCDNVVMSSKHSADISDAWKSAPRRISYEVEGEQIIWECPYIYLFGGYDAKRKLYNTIWQGVLTRLTFTPII